MMKTVALTALLAAMAAPVAAQPVAPPLDTQSFRMMASMSDGFEIESSRLALERSRNPRVLAFARRMIQDHSMTTAALNGGAPMAAGVGPGGVPTGAVAGAGIGGAVAGPVGAVVGAGVGATTGAVAAVPAAAGGAVAGTATGAAAGAAAAGPVGAVVGAGLGATTGAVGPLVTGSIGAPAPMDARKAAMLSQMASARGPAFDRLYGQAQRMAHQEALAVFTAYAQTGTDPSHVAFARSVIPHLQIHLAQARRLPGGR
jgi:predicted outer membrane protein